MKETIAFQTRLVNPRRETNHREFNDFLDHLDLIDDLLKRSGFEFEFIQRYLSELESSIGKALSAASIRPLHASKTA